MYKDANTHTHTSFNVTAWGNFKIITYYIREKYRKKGDRMWMKKGKEDRNTFYEHISMSQCFLGVVAIEYMTVSRYKQKKSSSVH